MPNFGYHLARAHGAAVRAIYRTALPTIVRRSIDSPNAVPLEIFSYSSESDVPEQVASIRSFLRFAGRPRRFTVTSDGTHSARSIALLEAIDAVVKVEQGRSDLPRDLSPKSRAFLSEHATGKQLALIMSLPRGNPALYIDADVLFFPGASELARRQPDPATPARYLADCRLSADERLFRDPSEKQSPINTGVLFLGDQLDWSESVARFDALDGAPDFFTNQTMTHLTMHACGAVPLDPAKYILQLDDQFIYADRHVRPEAVLRHYVRPVRHKFWTTLANSRWSA